MHKNRLVGRFDPKLDRETGVQHLSALYLQPGGKPDEALVTGVAGALRDFVAWHGAKSPSIDMSDPPAFAKKLLRAM